MTLKFEIKQIVHIDVGTRSEYGTIIARAEYATAEPSYLVRYKRADGVSDERWWSESALIAF